MIVDSTIRVGSEELSQKEWRKLLTALTFRDADETEIAAYEYLTTRDQVHMPRGAWALLPGRLEVNDLRCLPAAPKYIYAKTLDEGERTGQADAVRAMFEHGQGQVIAPPGSGKTEIAAAFIAACKTPTLVIVHTADLFKQWVDRMGESVPGAKVGVIQGKNYTVGHVTIAMAQTLKRYLHRGKAFWRQWGCLIIDEAHHAAAETWEWILAVCPAHYRFGITASQKRSDGREALVAHYIGPVIHKIAFESQVPMTIVPVTTPFTTKWPGQQWSRIMRELTRDEKRNAIIAQLIAAEVKKGHTILALSRQIKHLELIQEELRLAFDFDEGWMQSVKIVTGKLHKRERDKLIGQLRDGEIRCILGTQLFEEGIDIPRLNRIVLAFPGTEVTVLQKIGRGARTFEGKAKTIVYDIVDDKVPCLAKQYVRRRTFYKKKGNNITIGKAVRHDSDKKERRNILDRIRSATPRRPRAS